MDELLHRISLSTSGRQPASLTDRDKEEGGGGQSITGQHKLRAGWLCPSPSPFPSLLSPAPVPQPAGRGLRGDNGSVLIPPPSPEVGKVCLEAAAPWARPAAPGAGGD